ncbi:MAG: PDZ domain-containing protein [Gemmataceae bacterium]|nr:PDZ domain-containing protein [Gemmataceae bacterium]
MTRPATVGWMAAVGLLVAALPAGAQAPATRSDKRMLESFRPVVARPSESVVRVLASGKPVALGTVVSADGYIITKGSLLRGKLSVRLKGGRDYPATYVGLEPKFDLALLKVSGTNLMPIEWRDSKTAAVGDWVAAAGTGDVPVAVGVVGVATRKPKRFDFLRDPPPPGSGFMGVLLKDGDKAAAVDRVEKASPAEKAGLKPGDQVLSVDGKRVTDMFELIDLIQQFKAGTTVTLRVKRGDGKNETDLKVELGKRPAAPAGAERGDMQNRMGSELSKKRSGFPEIFQTDIVIKPGDCGGPAVDLDGKAVGVNIARGGRTESYAIPSEAVVALLPDLKAGKLPPPKDDTEDRVREAQKAVEAAQKLVSDAEKAKEEARKEGDPGKSLGARKALDEARRKLDAAEKALADLRGDPAKP